MEIILIQMTDDRETLAYDSDEYNDDIHPVIYDLGQVTRPHRHLKELLIAWHLTDDNDDNIEKKLMNMKKFALGLRQAYWIAAHPQTIDVTFEDHDFPLGVLYAEDKQAIVDKLEAVKRIKGGTVETFVVGQCFDCFRGYTNKINLAVMAIKEEKTTRKRKPIFVGNEQALLPIKNMKENIEIKLCFQKLRLFSFKSVQLNSDMDHGILSVSRFNQRCANISEGLNKISAYIKALKLQTTLQHGESPQWLSLLPSEREKFLSHCTYPLQEGDTVRTRAKQLLKQYETITDSFYEEGNDDVMDMSRCLACSLCIR